jgi:hypothetical protein
MVRILQEETRSSSCLTIGHLGSTIEDAISQLIGRLNDSDSNVRCKVVNSVSILAQSGG